MISANGRRVDKRGKKGLRGRGQMRRGRELLDQWLIVPRYLFIQSKEGAEERN